MRNFLLPVLGAGLLAFVSACSSSNNAAGAAGTPTGGSGGSAACTAGLTEVPASEFCNGVSAPTDCTQVQSLTNQLCGVPVAAPTDELGRSSTVKEFAGSGPPDLGCFQPANYPKLGTPGTAKVKGVVKIFSHGCDSKQVAVEFHTVTRSGPAQDPERPVIGTAIVTPDTCKGAGVSTETPDCSPRYECNYTYDGVPTETELVVLTKGDFWAPLYDFNIFIPNGEVTAGEWTHDVRALASDDYSVIAQAAIGSPVSPGNGAIAGEVHDCGDVRLHGATVNTEVGKRALTYFTNDEDHPLPESAATSTSNLGLYAAIDVSPGPASVAAVGLVGGKLTTVGYFRLKVFADSISAITFRGVRAFQTPP